MTNEETNGMRVISVCLSENEYLTAIAAARAARKDPSEFLKDMVLGLSEDIRLCANPECRRPFALVGRRRKWCDNPDCKRKAANRLSQQRVRARKGKRHGKP